MRKLTLLSAVFLLGIMLTQVGFANGTYKYKSAPHTPITSGQTTLDAIYVNVNVPISDVRVGLYAKTVMYSSLRVTLVSPNGTPIVLKAESGNPGGAPLYGSLGSERSHVLFRESGNALGAVPNDRPIDPNTSLTQLNGETSQGWWQLQIVDERNYSFNVYPQEGFLEEWTLMFNQQKVEPIQPFNPPVNILRPGGSTIRGQINGTTATFNDPNRAQIPNDNTNPGLSCNPPPADPSVVLGTNGDCFPIEITGHPGALIGTAANGYPSGRFRVTITVETNFAPGSTFITGLTEDIAIYFGRVPDAQYNPPLPSPPNQGDPGFQAKNPSGWPTGGGNIGSLQGGSSGPYGGVRLAACLSPVPGVDEYGFDRVTFDDFAIDQIANNLPAGPNGGFAGTYRPEQQFSSLNGLPVDGLYYVTVYDCFNDAQLGFGHIRVTYLQIEYIVGGGEISDPERHQGFVGPLLGVPVPGVITGTPLGYLADVVGVIPPYMENAKDQDPMLVFWATEKLYPKDAVGTERIMAVDMNNYAPPSATHYHGPYAYPGVLDSDPMVAGSLVNADLLIVPSGDYNLRVNLMQARYDDDLTDNEFESAKINVNPVSLSYLGEQIKFWNKFVDPAHANLIASSGITQGTAAGNSFTLFKYPYTTITSVDFKFDQATVITSRANVRVTIWSCANGFTGAPTTVVARSPIVNLNQYIEGNWRTFPIYPIDANGNADIAAGGSVNLPQGTYVVCVDNVDTQGNTYMIYPYTYGAIPALKDRFNSYRFNDLFGPLGPYNTLGTRMGYFNSDIATPPNLAWGGTNNANMANHTLPIRLNMVNMNDFSVNFVKFTSQTSPTEAISVGQPNTPSVNITANSTQGGLTKDFNIYLGIYDAGNNLLYSDMVNIAGAPYNGIAGYQTISVNMDSWTPQSGGIYKVKAYFTRKPDDQNPVNDMIEYFLFVQSVPIIAYDNGTDRSLVDAASSLAAERGMNPVLVNIDEMDLSSHRSSTIYFAGSMTDAAKAQLAAAIANGNDIAFVYDRSQKLGATVQKIDNLYGIERAREVNYALVEQAATLSQSPDYVQEEAVQPITIPQITSKEQLLTYLASREAKITQPADALQRSGASNTAFDNVLPIFEESAYGSIRFLGETSGSLGIVYTVPSVRKAGDPGSVKPAPTAFALEQNYPNPFNPSTVITYTLSEASVVTLRVIDVLGREVATLVSQTQDAGTYSISWKGLSQNGVEVPSGSYFYRIDAVPTSGAAVFSSTKKMVLSK